MKQILGVALFISIFSSYFFTACRKVTGCTTHQSSDVFEVEIPVTLYPAKDTFEIGDTIWIEQNFSDQMHDRINGMTLNFGTFQFNNKFSTSDLLKPYDFIAKQQQTAEIGQIEHHGFYSKIIYLHEQNFYKSKIRIIITDKGLFNYGFVPVNLNSDFTKCPAEYLTIKFNTNNHGNNNFHMMKLSPDTITVNASKEEFDKLGSYCFYVK